jgi:predicted metal-binding membrane protein
MLAASVERWIHHDRLVVALALTFVCTMAWLWLLAGAGMGISAAGMTRAIYGDHSAMAGMWMPASWSVAYALLMFAMWWVMMIAMMLPSAAPVILLAARVNRTAPAHAPPFGSSAGFALGYLLAWGVFSAATTALQWALERAGLLSAMTLSASSRTFAIALLLAAAAWQLSPLKATCLTHCRAPFEWVMAARGRSALATGLRHGSWCVGCCWLLMALLFVGGVMNLFWIAGLSALVLAEKLLPPARAVSRASAAMLTLFALVLVIT